ncbi:MAG: methionine synthase, partial [Brevundimonas sp.]
DEIARFHTLRQQIQKSNGKPNLALSDFVSETAPDYIGAFAVTAGHGELEIAKRFKDAGDDYSAILATALADRLAEAFAERLHKEVRTQLWGYAANEATSVDELIAEQYQGIRPAPGYPAQPDHTEKATLFRLLNAGENAGMALTESYAMTPPASVSGLYFGHPGSHYFGVGKIDRDQVADYATRKGWDLDTAEKWLAPILNYDPGVKARESAA